jgi:patatin-related protein
MSQPAPPATAENGTRPEVQYTQEVRFAVVMYGGSSLAIYMNGVAQELLRLVRSTAPERDGGGAARAYLPDAGLKGSERVYRKLGRMLVRGDEEDAVAARAARAAQPGPLHTRFVVDVLTGSSAGGINAVYLAKALANDQSLDNLMELWVSKGDIGILLNVPDSAKITVNGRESRLDFTGQPLSPLNSSRMYWELLDALRGMDAQTGAQASAPPGGPRPLYAEELDLYVTATDTRGRIMNMRLADRVVEELRHRNVFHFRYRDGDGQENDFKPEFNSFLAFAARCTSAHQAAFEVMNMESGGRIVEGTGGDRPPELNFRDERLQKFYEDYLLASGNIKAAGGRAALANDFHGRFFNDGGTLDNSPFSFVSDVLPFRQTLHPVDRKLLYVEPSPEHPGETDPGNRQFNFVKNAVTGLSTLPSHQTIVEDLTRIQQRNRLVERVNRILTDLREDIRARNDDPLGGVRERPRSLEQMRHTKLSQLIREKGISWGGYQRLRIAQVTDDLTLLISRAAGIDEESDEFQAVRYLVRRWRLSRFEDHEEGPGANGATGATPPPTGGAPAKLPEMGFLVDFDLSWTIRRVQFLLRTIDELDCFDKSAKKIADATEQAGVKITWPESEQERQEFRDELRRVRGKINAVYSGLRAARRRFWARRAAPAAEPGGPEQSNPFREEVDALGVPKSLLIKLLHLPSEAERTKMIGEFLGVERNAAAFMNLSATVQAQFEKEMRTSRWACGRALRYPRRGGSRLGPKESVRYVLSFYYRFFEDFDQVTFPIFYSTDVGEETDPIEVFRVSPEDAFLLVNEQDVNAERKAARQEGRIDKLAGTSVGHFGAFFDVRYRVNDILWGRLDGAERIIGALLPGDANQTQREALVREAHREIILETWEKVLSGLDDGGLAAEVRRALERVPDAEREKAREGALPLQRRLAAGGVGALWRHYFRKRVGKGDANEVEDFRQAFLDSYDEEREFSTGRKLKLARQGSRVLAKILRSNLKESSRRKGPAWSLIVGALLTLGGFVAFFVGLGKVVTGLPRLILSLFRRDKKTGAAG